MKRYDAMRLSGTVLLAHLALCAAFLLLLIAASGSTSTFTFRSPYGLVLGLLFIGLPAFAFGWGLRSAKDPFDKKLCWNAAMVLYVLNAAAFLLAPEFGTGNVIAMWWGMPMAPALAGLNAFAAPQSALYLFGGALHQAFPRCAVNVHDPELTVFIEIRDDAAYVHGPAEAGAGGLPIGMGGSAVSLLSGGIDSPVASYMMAKRGVSLEMVHFFSPPYTSDAAKEKVLELAQLLTPWCGRLTVHIVPFTEIQEQIRMNCPEDHFTLIMRRFMMRLAQRVADEVRAKALVTGECLGQVASQTMEALRVSEDVVELPVLRPLIGMDKEELIRISRKIGTFDTSILPYEDCCTVFTPRHPKTKPHVEEVRELEAVLDIDALCDRAMAGRERVRIKL